MTTLLDALFEGQRQKVLAFLYLRPTESIHVREIARATGAHAGSLHRELARLAAAGLLLRHSVGNQVQYQANASCLVFAELASLFRKTTGIAVSLREALQPLARGIVVAFIFGSMARGTEHTHSDIDLFVVGRVDYRSLVEVLHPFEVNLTREINPCLYSPDELRDKLQDGDSFLKEVIDQPKLFVLGSNDDLGKLSVDRGASEGTR